MEVFLGLIFFLYLRYMRNKLYITFLWAAGLILFAHSVVPHVHHSPKEPLEVCESEDSKSVLDYLASVFHYSTGDIEHFQIQNGTSITGMAFFWGLMPEQVQVTLPFQEVVHFIPFTALNLATSDVGIEVQTLRGPPCA